NVTDDSIYELTEDFTVDLSDAVEATISDAQGVGTILDDDYQPILIVGSADDDTGTSGPSYTYGTGSGTIEGDGGDDILIGDPGGTTTLSEGDTANIAFVLDTSGSMDTNISFGGGSISRLAAMKQAVIDSLNDLYNSGAENIRIHIVQFNNNGSTVGTYDLTSGGVDDPTALASAIAAVNDLTASGWTNYEGGLQEVIDWITPGDSDPLASADVNKVVFISDGEPNRALNNSGGVVSVTASEAMQHVLGTYDTWRDSNDDSVSEVATIEGSGFTIEAIGIKVGSTALGYLSQVEGSGGSATNITTAEELSAVVGELSGGQSTQPAAAGDDTIIGGDGDDIIFGDAPNTDALADDPNGDGATGDDLGTPDGAGWQVFDDLGWSESAMVDYINDNHEALSAESGRTGGNDTISGGAGDDIIYGQEGNDIIDGGSGNDILVGGSGDDILTGGSGADTFKVGDGHDHITDYNKLVDGDKVDISHILDVETQDNQLAVVDNGGKAKLVIYDDAAHTNEIGSVTFDTINFGDAPDVDTLKTLVDFDDGTNP
ncbi:MAG: VWA domain-containing protein, partial [Desulfobacterales bacterium]|nr:VWA domain-containing protein [Desulfobacterales bacterium]